MEQLADYLTLRELIIMNQVNKYWNGICNEKIYRQLSIPEDELAIFKDENTNLSTSDKLELLLYSLETHGTLVQVLDFGSLYIEKVFHHYVKEILQKCPNLIAIYWDHFPIDLFKIAVNRKIERLSIPRDVDERLFQKLDFIKKANLMSHSIPLSKIYFSSTLVSLYMFKCTFINTDLQQLLQLQNIKSLSLEKCKLKTIALTSTYSYLIKLSIDTCSIPPKFNEFLQTSCPFLQVLWFWCTTINHVGYFKYLNWLRIHSPDHTNVLTRINQMPISRLEVFDYTFSSAEHTNISQLPLHHLVLRDCINCNYNIKPLHSIALSFCLPHPQLTDLYLHSEVRLFHMPLLTNFIDISSFLNNSKLVKLYTSESLVINNERDHVKQLGKVILGEDLLGVKMSWK